MYPKSQTGCARGQMTNSQLSTHSSSALGSENVFKKWVTLSQLSEFLVQLGQNTHVHLTLPDLDLYNITLCTSGRLCARQDMRSFNPAM